MKLKWKRIAWLTVLLAVMMYVSVSASMIQETTTNIFFMKDLAGNDVVGSWICSSTAEPIYDEDGTKVGNSFSNTANGTLSIDSDGYGCGGKGDASTITDFTNSNPEVMSVEWEPETREDGHSYEGTFYKTGSAVLGYYYGSYYCVENYNVYNYVNPCSTFTVGTTNYASKFASCNQTKVTSFSGQTVKVAAAGGWELEGIRKFKGDGIIDRYYDAVTVSNGGTISLEAGYALSAVFRNTETGAYTDVKLLGTGSTSTSSGSTTGTAASGSGTGATLVTPKTVYGENYSVSIASIKVNGNGKAQKPKITVKYNSKKVKAKYYTVKYSANKYAGLATVTVKGKGSYKSKIPSTKLQFVITPKKMKTPTVKAGKGIAKVSWKTEKQVSGYQIQIASNKKFSSNVQTLNAKSGQKNMTISELTSKKTYYVRTRAYKTIQGEIFYGKWSSAKKVKIK